MAIRGMSIAGLAAAAMASATQPSPDEFAHLALLNGLRAEGVTCPDGTVYPPNPTPLKWDCALWRASRAHSQEMAENDYFGHQSLDGSLPGDRARAEGTTFASENIAAGQQDPAASFRQWVESESGHCNGMMDASRKSVAVGYGSHINGKWFSYWTQMSSDQEPITELQSCGVDADGTIHYAPTAPPSAWPTTAEATNNFLDFEINSYEMELLMHINQARKEGNQEECYGEFYQDLPPLEWNCGLFRAARRQAQDAADGKCNFGRNGPGGISFVERSHAEGVPYSCADFVLTGSKWEGGEGSQYASPASVAQRLISCCCWAVFGTYKSFGAAYASGPEPQDGLPPHGWLVLFNRHEPPAEVQTCGGAEAPVPAPTAAPTEVPATPEPTVEPTLAPVEPQLGGCAVYTKKNKCTADGECAWRSKTCQRKADVCPVQKNQTKCDKYNCNWEAATEICSWSS